MKTSYSFVGPATILTLSFATIATTANEPLWTDQVRMENRDVVCIGQVRSIARIGRIDGKDDLYLAEVELAEITKGKKLPVGSRVNVYYGFSSSGAGKRCPAYAELSKDEVATFYLRNLNDELKQVLKIERIKEPAFFLELGSDVQKQKAPASPAPKPTAAFGPVIERTLGQLELLDLDTDQKAFPIAQGEPKQQADLDVFLDFGARAHKGTYPMLVSQFLYTLRATNWNVSPGELEAVLRGKEVPDHAKVLARPSDPLPLTYWFRTRAGNIGVLQVLGFKQESPEEVTIRYLLFKTNQ